MNKLLSKSRIAISLAAILALSACLDTQNAAATPPPTQPALDERGRASFLYKVPSSSNKRRALLVSASKGDDGGPHAGYPFSVTISVSRDFGTINQRAVEHLTAANPSLAAAVANDSPENPVSDGLIQQFATEIGALTVCQNGRIGPNTVGRSYSSSADISDILAANGGRALGGRIPDGIKGNPIQPVRRTRFGWDVSLWCT